MSYIESSRRSILKTISWRLIAVTVTSSIALAVTSELKVAATIGAIDTLVKLRAYYYHERFWNRIDFGRSKPPDYEI